MKRNENYRVLSISVQILMVMFICRGGEEPVHAIGSVSVTPVAGGFSQPVDIANAGDDRLFIVQQRGLIRIIDGSGTVLPLPFLDLTADVSQSGSEQGLLGLAFHPMYASNGYFYVNYTDITSGSTTISRFSVSGDPDIADAGSESVILSIAQPFSNHNGGDLSFGPDGYLYIGTGDGGSAGDPGNRAQDPLLLLGKMLRIDVDGGTPYAVPPDNPFVGVPGTLDEIWALGLRNPWRFSFDRLTGDMWIGDVGQSSWEEVDFEPAASSGGNNYGWRCYEGNAEYSISGCGPAGDYVFPVGEYSHAASNCSITGGYVYRGSDYPGMYGHYLFADYCSGVIWSLYPDGVGGFDMTELANLTDYNVVSFGEDSAGELYLAGLSDGVIYRVIEIPGTATPSPTPGADAIPSTGPAGITMLMALMGLLILVSRRGAVSRQRHP